MDSGWSLEEKAGRVAGGGGGLGRGGVHLGSGDPEGLSGEGMAEWKPVFLSGDLG